MNDLLNTLYELESIDNQIFEIKRKMGNMPVKREELQKQYDEIHGKMDALNEEEKILTAEIAKIKQDKEIHVEKIASDKEYLSTVKSNEEYMLILNGIGNLEVNIKAGDDRIRVINTRLEEIGIIKNDISQNDSSDTGTKQEIENLNNELVHDEQVLSDIQSHRDAIIRSLPEDIQKRYDRIYQKRQGIAISLLNSQNCPGCFSEIPEQLIQDVRQMEKINYCMHCGRILLWKKDEDKS